MHHIATARLQLRPLHASDAPFMLKLLNEPAFIANIGDKDAHDLLGALRYIEEGPQTSYRKHGHGLLLVEQLDDGAPVGICGLVKRDGLDYPDIGYAFLEQYWGCGYASEAALAAIEHGREQLGHAVVVGITAPHNLASIRVLEKIGLLYQGRIELPGIDGDSCYFVPPALLKDQSA
ncbi:GNAT family N-acetyltransferase [Chromobacterium haemolyticum]|uniref:GNAT family N-acetyltransferase n=1 Tax=Chromobacterium haemolyticum TaxID=394935 RepID=UPI0009DB0C31|nr:GNAT family N-acetyltransferase [Chromobacterium haemolyticum]OQS44468.1 GNAT family N-acetyltransferase [Chromobacterium haemolyticum]